MGSSLTWLQHKTAQCSEKQAIVTVCLEAHFGTVSQQQRMLWRLQREIQKNTSKMSNCGPMQTLVLQDLIDILYFRESVDITDVVSKKFHNGMNESPYLSEMEFLLIILLYYNIQKFINMQSEKLWWCLFRMFDTKIP